MFLEQFLIGNLWNSSLICVMLGMKRLLRNRLSLRFQYHSWYVLLGSLFMSLLPSQIWSEFRLAKSVEQQAFAISNASDHAANAAMTGIGWIQDTTELIADTENSQFAFFLLMIWLVGVLTIGGVYLCGSWRLHSIKQSAAELTSRIWKRFNACNHRLGLIQDIELRQSRFITAPVSFGLRKSLVVLPEGSIDRLMKN